MQIESWRAAYAGIIAPATLAGLDFSRSAIRWQRALDEGLPTLVAEVAGETEPHLAGFVTVERDEISMLYVVPQHWRQGIGRRLLRAALAWHEEQGRSSAALWVLAANARARAFYEAQGGEKVAEGRVRVGNEELPQVRYIWRFPEARL